MGDQQYFSIYADEATAVADAKAKVKDGGIVGLPALSPLSPEAYQRYRGWISSEINVNPAHFATYTTSLENIPLVPEPATRAQEVYPILGTLVQQALGSASADLGAAMADASRKIERAIRQ